MCSKISSDVTVPKNTSVCRSNNHTIWYEREKSQINVVCKKIWINSVLMFVVPYIFTQAFEIFQAYLKSIITSPEYYVKIAEKEHEKHQVDGSANFLVVSAFAWNPVYLVNYYLCESNTLCLSPHIKLTINVYWHS